jgi:hypothetical protein
MKVTSSHILEIEWISGNLDVLFKTGVAYRYHRVQRLHYDHMEELERSKQSVGKYFDTYIKKNPEILVYEKIDWNSPDRYLEPDIGNIKLLRLSRQELAQKLRELAEKIYPIEEQPY